MNSSYVRMLSHFRYVRVFAIPWAVAHQAPLFWGFARQEYWSWAAMPSSRGSFHPEIEPASFMSPALAGGFFITSDT